MVTTRRNDAPGELELVRAFINTAHLERGADDLEQPADLRRWLVSRELLADYMRTTNNFSRRPASIS